MPFGTFVKYNFCRCTKSKFRQSKYFNTELETFQTRYLVDVYKYYILIFENAFAKKCTMHYSKARLIKRHF